jgi:DNA-binding winged helix-turn-helix (wHTH) protein
MSEYLRIIKGEPYDRNTMLELNLDKKDYKLGRIFGKSIPDIDFSNTEVSREHAIISKRDGCCYIKNLSSTNGVGINGTPKCKSVADGSEVILNDKDIICLTRDVMFQFFDRLDPGMTFSIIGNCKEDQCRFEDDIPSGSIQGLMPLKRTYDELINEDRGELLCNGRWVYLKDKYWDFVKLLCKTPGELVSHEKLIEELWDNEEDVKAEENSVRRIAMITRQKINAVLGDEKGKDIILTRKVKGVSGYIFNDRL